MGGFQTWGATAAGIANSYGVNPAIFDGLIDAESSWNPNATPGTTSAYGFTQLLKGTAAGLGVNRFNPIQNMQGGASYLSSLLKQFGGNYTQALAAYHDGPGAVGLHGGYQYAQTVLNKATKYAGGGLSDMENTLAAGADALFPGAGDGIRAALGIAGVGAGSSAADASGGCGLNPICYLQQWMKNSGFFERLALAVLGLIVLYAALQLLKGNSQTSAVGTVKKAAGKMLVV